MILAFEQNIHPFESADSLSQSKGLYRDTKGSCTFAELYQLTEEY